MMGCSVQERVQMEKHIETLLTSRMCPLSAVTCNINDSFNFQFSAVGITFWFFGQNEINEGNKKTATQILDEHAE